MQLLVEVEPLVVLVLGGLARRGLVGDDGDGYLLGDLVLVVGFVGVEQLEVIVVLEPGVVLEPDVVVELVFDLEYFGCLVAHEGPGACGGCGIYTGPASRRAFNGGGSAPIPHRENGGPGDRWGHCLARPALQAGYSSVLYLVS